MKYSEFFRFLKKWRVANRFPPRSGYPRYIYFDDAAWEGINRLYNLTNMDQHEYETSLFYVEGDTFPTTPLRGSTHQVNANHNLEVKYKVNETKRMFERYIIIDGQTQDKSLISPDKLNRNTEAGFLFNIHTHPEHINGNGQTTYSFFSDTDIRSLLGSPAMVTGLITDAFWMVCKTDEAISKVGEVGEEMLRDISHHAFAGETYLDDLIRTQMARWGLVFYRAEFRKPLERVN
jgi:hypothetical protein